ncbi:MAG TPA: hypothetical protein VGV39_15250 [Mesorhizobium sp.]|jgi:hypothetical protein|uniref:hypothetical protein n=1 Tax=Mesorhizobium sp. TaxID=1871066 RepID=UPI002DDCDE77|nr:hypothetical protein [Mesorhizobium sp.]HEV2504434.1 hypothetical protein [Mesorhizobium sp.]
MTALEMMIATRARLDTGEPLRLLIGHTLHRASEIVPAPKFLADLRTAIACDLDEQIAALTETERLSS